MRRSGARNKKGPCLLVGHEANMKDRRDREARGQRWVTRACKTRRRQWRTAAEDCEQPGGDLARVFWGGKTVAVLGFI